MTPGGQLPSSADNLLDAGLAFLRGKANTQP
jgi:hypothetical protein